MALIENVQVKTWANGRARPLADKMAAMLPVLQAYQADWAAQGIQAAINGDPAGAASVIDDGSAMDGRQPITGTNLTNLLAAINQLVTAWNTTLVSGVGTTVAAQENLIQVNGSPR